MWHSNLIIINESLFSRNFKSESLVTGLRALGGIRNMFLKVLYIPCVYSNSQIWADEAAQEMRSDYGSLKHYSLLFSCGLYNTTAMIRTNPWARGMDNGKICEKISLSFVRSDGLVSAITSAICEWNYSVGMWSSQLWCLNFQADNQLMPGPQQFEGSVVSKKDKFIKRHLQETLRRRFKHLQGRQSVLKHKESHKGNRQLLPRCVACQKEAVPKAPGT